MKLSAVSFQVDTWIPNLKNQKGATAIGQGDNKGGFDIEYDEEHRFVRIEALKPNDERQVPVCIPMENVASFRIVGDANAKPNPAVLKKA